MLLACKPSSFTLTDHPRAICNTAMSSGQESLLFSIIDFRSLSFASEWILANDNYFGISGGDLAGKSTAGHWKIDCWTLENRLLDIDGYGALALDRDASSPIRARGVLTMDLCLAVTALRGA